MNADSLVTDAQTREPRGTVATVARRWKPASWKRWKLAPRGVSFQLAITGLGKSIKKPRQTRPVRGSNRSGLFEVCLEDSRPVSHAHGKTRACQRRLEFPFLS